MQGLHSQWFYPQISGNGSISDYSYKQWKIDYLLSTCYAHCKNGLVVLTAEWLPRLHGLLWYQRLLRQPVSLLFPSLPSFWNKEKRRKQQGNYLLACFIQLASDTIISHATRITTLWLKQLICFYSAWDVHFFYNVQKENCHSKR